MDSDHPQVVPSALKSTLSSSAAEAAFQIARCVASVIEVFLPVVDGAHNASGLQGSTSRTPERT